MSFFYGADLGAFCDTEDGFLSTDGPQVITTGLTGDHQIIFGLTGSELLSVATGVWGADEQGRSENNQGVQFGIATRNGVAGAPDGQCAAATAQRDNASAGRIGTIVRDNSTFLVLNTSAVTKNYIVDSINNGNFVVSTPQSGNRAPIAFLVLQTDNLQTHCSIEDSPGATWTVTTGFEPQLAALFASQTTAVNANVQMFDIEGSAHAFGTSAQQSSHSLSDEDGAGTIVSRHLQSSKFIHALQDDGSVGWEQASVGNFSLTATGWQVDSITVSNPTTRKWLTWAIEKGTTGPPPTEITGTGTLQAQSASVSGVGTVGPVVEVGAVVHREQLGGGATGSWQVRPAALAGITPKAVLVFGQARNSILDGSTLGNGAFFIGLSDGTNSYCRSAIADNNDLDGQKAAYAESGNALIYTTNDTASQDRILVNGVSLVSGGLVATVQAITNDFPSVNFVFFVGDDVQTHTERMPGINSGTRIINTGFSGVNDNQLAIFLPTTSATPDAGLKKDQNAYWPTLGFACRQGAAGAPDSQSSHAAFTDRRESGASRNGSIIADNRCVQGALDTAIQTSLECTDIQDNQITLTHRAGASARGAYVLALTLGSTKAYTGLADALTASGNWIVNGPNFPCGLALSIPTQVTTPGDIVQASENVIGGASVGDLTAEYSACWSNEDDASPTVAKSRQNSQYLDVLQGDGSIGWAAPAGNFALTDTGFRVDSVTVNSGAPATTRKWQLLVLEGEPPPTKTGTGALQAGDATITGVGEVRTPSVGTGALQAQAAAVSGLGAVVNDGAGALQAAPAVIVGAGEVGDAKAGAGVLQAGDAVVSGSGVREAIGTGALQAEPAAVLGVGAVEGLTSGMGALQAGVAEVSGQGSLEFVGAGALQAQQAQIAGVGFLLGEVTLTPGDLAAIQDAVWTKLVSEGLVTKINELWQRRGLDPANPQTYDKAGSEIRVGEIKIGLSGDDNAVTQSREGQFIP